MFHVKHPKGSCVSLTAAEIVSRETFELDESAKSVLNVYGSTSVETSLVGYGTHGRRQ